ncbi:LuxR C-terminal-related transcriptional regulator [Cupriavidus necator]
MLSSGYRNRVIAQKLVLSELTVKSHMWRIHPELGAQRPLKHGAGARPGPDSVSLRGAARARCASAVLTP